MYIKVKFKDLTVLNTRILHLLMPFKPFYNIYQQNKFDNKHQKKTNQSNQNKSKTKQQITACKSFGTLKYSINNVFHTANIQKKIKKLFFT